MSDAVPPTQRFSGAAGDTSVAATPSSKPPVKRFVRQQVPDHILNDPELRKAANVLPSNYNFEVYKTVWRLRESKVTRLALQFPEGLLMYACTLADIFRGFSGVQHVYVMGDVTYGACCVDDYSALAVAADLLIHYGHSCLVPVNHTKIPCMYVFVDIQVDLQHLVDTVALNFDKATKLLLAGTIQFVGAIQAAKREIEKRGFEQVSMSQAKPLSPGETLGCTAPALPDNVDVIVFVADGRFHLEALMIANPAIPAFRYDPYGRVMVREAYDHAGMQAARREAILAARECSSWGLVLGTLGRQGNPALLQRLEAILTRTGKDFTVVLLSELTPAKLLLMPDIDAWVQVACPRLSIDWGERFHRPVLTPYEAMVCFHEAPAWWEASGDDTAVGQYPMDYYAKQGGAWSSSYHKPREGLVQGSK